VNNKIFIIAGGPSVKEVNLELLKDQHVITVNMGYRLPISTMNYSNDQRFLQIVRNREDWISYKGKKYFAKLRKPFNYPQDVTLVPITNVQEVPLRAESIFAGNNSGFGAIQLAIWLGFRRIFLIGYDMRMQGVKTHWHEEYRGQNNSTSYRSKKLDSFKEQIREFAPLWFAAGIDISICTPSALRCFEYVPLEEVT